MQWNSLFENDVPTALSPTYLMERQLRPSLH